MARGERGRFLGLLARHVVAAAGLSLRPRGRGSMWRDGAGPKRALFLSAYPPGHYGTQFRLARWIPHLEARGWSVELRCNCTDEEWEGFRSGDLPAVYRYHRSVLRNSVRSIRRAAGADVVWMHRGLAPFGPWQRPTFERRLARANPRLVHDFYDSIWVNRREMAAACRGREARWLNPPDLVESILDCAAAATVSNAHLGEFAAARRARVLVLPMVVEPAEYRVREHRDRDRVVLGWMGGPWNVARLGEIAAALRQASAEVRIALRVVSPGRVEVPGVETEFRDHPWSAESEVEDLAGFDVGLLPLVDGPRDRGKSPLKLVQYAAAGLPIVASPVAVDRERFRHGREILYARTEEEWTEAVVGLARDPARRAELGLAARKVVTEHYSYEAHAGALDRLLRDVTTIVPQ